MGYRVLWRKRDSMATLSRGECLPVHQPLSQEESSSSSILNRSPPLPASAFWLVSHWSPQVHRMATSTPGYMITFKVKEQKTNAFLFLSNTFPFIWMKSPPQKTSQSSHYSEQSHDDLSLYWLLGKCVSGKACQQPWFAQPKDEPCHGYEQNWGLLAKKPE